MPRRRLIVLLAINGLLIALNWFLFVHREEAVLLAINANAGCFPWSPAVVEYRPGMTLCPGQSATIVMTVPIE